MQIKAVRDSSTVADGVLKTLLEPNASRYTKLLRFSVSIVRLVYGDCEVLAVATFIFTFITNLFSSVRIIDIFYFKTNKTAWE